MIDLLLTIGVFIAFHLIPAIGPVRRFLLRAMGLRMYVGLYSAVSVGLLILVSVAYVNADSDILWPQWPWTRWVPVVIMPFVSLLLVSTLSEPNPFSRSEEHTSELQSHHDLVCRLLLEKKKQKLINERKIPRREVQEM